MKKIIIILTTITSLYACKKGDYYYEDAKEEKLMPISTSENNMSVELFIQLAINNNNPARLEFFSTLISHNNPQFNKLNTKEIKVTNNTTNKKSIAYIDETKLVSPANYHLISGWAEYIQNSNKQSIGAVYEGYVLFDDGCFYYGRTIVGNNGSSVFIMAPWEYMFGYDPICTDIDMETLC